jgi:hypothetical protein
MSNTSQFDNARFFSLETYRKNGQPMPTAVWFAALDGGYVFQTQLNAGKVKRIRNNPRVRIAPCDQRGKVLGEYVDASAQVITGTPLALAAQQVLAKKYGLQKKLFDLINRKKGYDTVRVVPAGS